MRSRSCVDQVRTDNGEVVLNASTLSDNSLRFFLTTEFPLTEQSADTSALLKFLCLLDSGSTDCFIDSNFVLNNDIPTASISPINLRLFDGSLAHSAITETASLEVRFLTGKLLPLTFFVTPLDSSCKAVLGYSFLTRYNPLVDWVSRNITFRNTKQPVSSTSTPIGQPNRKEPLPDQPVTGSPYGNWSRISRQTRCSQQPLSDSFPYEPIYSYPSVAQMASCTEMSDTDVNIAFVSATAFHQICKKKQVATYITSCCSF